MVFAGRLICMFNYRNAEHGSEEGSWSSVPLIISAYLFHIQHCTFFPLESKYIHCKPWHQNIYQNFAKGIYQQNVLRRQILRNISTQIFNICRLKFRTQIFSCYDLSFQIRTIYEKFKVSLSLCPYLLDAGWKHRIMCNSLICLSYKPINPDEVSHPQVAFRNVDNAVEQLEYRYFHFSINVA